MSTHHGEGFRIIEVFGDIDIDSAGELRAALYEAVLEARLVVADLSGVTWAELPAIGALALVTHVAEQMDRQVRLAAPHHSVRFVAARVGAARLLRVFPSVAAALGAPAMAGQPVLTS